MSGQGTRGVASNSTGYNMHGCVLLGEMTWTRLGHSGLLESIQGQAAGLHLVSARLFLDFTLAGIHFRVGLHDKLYIVCFHH